MARSKKLNQALSQYEQRRSNNPQTYTNTYDAGRMDDLYKVAEQKIAREAAEREARRQYNLEMVQPEQNLMSQRNRAMTSSFSPTTTDLNSGNRLMNLAAQMYDPGTVYASRQRVYDQAKANLDIANQEFNGNRKELEKNPQAMFDARRKYNEAKKAYDYADFKLRLVQGDRNTTAQPEQTAPEEGPLSLEEQLANLPETQIGVKDPHSTTVIADVGQTWNDPRALARHEAAMKAEREANMQASLEQARQFGQEHPLVGSGLSLTSNLVGSALSPLETARAKLTGEETDINSPMYRMTRQGSAYREGATQGIKNDLGVSDYDQNGNRTLGSQAVDFAMGTGLSTVETVIRSAMLGPFAGSVQASLSAASQGFIEQKEKGRDDLHAIATGIAQGIAEGAFEHFSLENLAVMKANPVDSIPEFLKNLGKQSFTEGSEEFFTDWANAASDYFINGGDSEWSESYIRYLRQGMTEDEAFWQVFKDTLGQSAMSFLGGAISGGLLGGGVQLTQGRMNYKQGQAMAQNGERFTGDELRQIAEATDTDEASYTNENGEIDTEALEQAQDTQKYLTRLADRAESRKLTDWEQGAAFNEIGRQAGNLTVDTPEMSEDEEAKASMNADIRNSLQERLGNSPQNNLSRLFESTTQELSETFGDEGRNLFTEQANSNRDSAAYFRAFSNVYNSGAYGQQITPENQAYINQNMSQEDVHNILMAGAHDSKAAFEASVKRAQQAAESARKFNAGGNAKVSYDFDPNSLTKNQQAYVAAWTGLLKDGLGINVHWYRSDVDATGKYTNPANGSYTNSTNTIALDVYAGAVRVGDSVKLNTTISHEITHWMEVHNPEAYERLKNTVLNALASDKGYKFGDDITTVVANEMKRRGSTRADAEHELVARACEDMLSGSKKAEQFLNSLDTDTKKTIFDHVNDVFNTIKDFFKNLLSGQRSNSEEARSIRRNLEVLERLQEQWNQMFEEGFKGGAVLSESTAQQQDIEEKLESADKGSEYSMRQFANALDFDISYDENGVWKIVDKDGKPVTHVTRDQIKQTSMGILIQAAEDAGTINSIVANKQRKMFTDLMNLTLEYDPSSLPMIWEIAGSMMFSSVKTNSDAQYSTTVDYGTICSKTQALVDVLSKTMLEKGRGLTRDEVITAYNETAKQDLSVPCPVCYVFSRWMGVPSLLDSMRRCQERFENASENYVQRYIKDMLDKYGDAKAINNRKTSVQNRMQTLERSLQLANDKNDLKKLKEIRKETTELQREMDDLEMFNWVTQVRCVSDGKGGYKLDKNYKSVPMDILLDLRRSGDFASQYSKSWKYRTTRGAGMGKAIMPYSGATIGDFIKGTKDRYTAAKNPFTQKNLKTATAAVKRAITRAAAQNLIGGQRFQSTSDYRAEWGIDYLMTFLECQAAGSQVQLYTKVIEAVDFLASAGAEVNLSIMPQDNGYITLKNGKKKLVFSNVTGINFDEAHKKVQKYDNVQMILVGINDEHIRLAMADDRITFIIPWHSSGNSKETLAQLMGAVGETLDIKENIDYSESQTDKVIDNSARMQRLRQFRKEILQGKLWENYGKRQAKTLNKEQRQLLADNPWLNDLYNRFYLDESAQEYGVRLNGKQTSSIFPYEYWDKSLTIKAADQNGRRFQEYCASLGIQPRFSQFKDDTGYWKLLIDRKMYNNDGTYHAPKAIDVTNVKVSSMPLAVNSNNYKDMNKINQATMDTLRALDGAGNDLEAVDNGDANKYHEVQNVENASEEKQFSIRSAETGYSYAEIETDASELKGLKGQDLCDKVEDIINSRFSGHVLGVKNGTPVVETKRGAHEYANSERRLLGTKLKEAKFNAAFQLDDLLAAAYYMDHKTYEDIKIDHPESINGLDHYEVFFKVGDNYFRGVVTVLNQKRVRTFYDVTRIKNINANDIRPSNEGGHPPKDVLTYYLPQNANNNNTDAPENTSENNPEYTGEYPNGKQFQHRVTEEEKVPGTNKNLLNYLNKQVKDGDYTTTYKAFLKIGDTYYSPMASLEKDEKGKYTKLRNGIKLKQWLASDGKLTDEDIAKMKMNTDPNNPMGQYGYYVLKKSDEYGNYIGDVEAAYNPYQHSSDLVINDQFQTYYARPGVVVVECRIPNSEIDNPYWAPYAKDPTGKHEWKAGSIARQLEKTERSVYMTRYIQPIRELSHREVAEKIRDIVLNEDHWIDMHWNVMHPEVVKELESMGITIDPYGSNEHIKDANKNITDRYGNPIPKNIRDEQRAERDVLKKARDKRKDAAKKAAKKAAKANKQYSERADYAQLQERVTSKGSVEEYKKAFDDLFDILWNYDYEKGMLSDAFGSLTENIDQMVDEDMIDPDDAEKAYPLARKLDDAYYNKLITADDMKDYEDDEEKPRNPRRDSTGRVLSNNQQEYFKDSKARDEEGNLLTLYHGTRFAGFTEFKTDRGVWLTTSRADADSYGANWEHKLFDPNEQEEHRQTESGDYRIGENLRFDTEKDRDDFLKRYPDAEKYMTEREEIRRQGELDEISDTDEYWDLQDEYDAQVKRDAEIFKAYMQYEWKHSKDISVQELVDNYEQYSLNDIKRAWQTLDREVSFDDEMDYDSDEEYRDVLAEGLIEYMNSEDRSVPWDEYTVKARIPAGQSGEIVNRTDQRTYELYANVTNPYIFDNEGRGSEGNGRFYSEIEKAMSDPQYDGVIAKNARVGRYQNLGTVVLVKNPNQVKLASNLNPTSNNDIQFSERNVEQENRIEELVQQYNGDYVAALSDIEVEYERKLSDVRAEYEQQIEKLNAEIEKTKGKEREKKKESLKKLREKKNQKIKDLKQEYRDKVERARERRKDRDARTRLLRKARELARMKGGPEFEASKQDLIGDLDMIAKGIMDKTRQKLEEMKARATALAEEDENYKALYFDSAREVFERLEKKHIKDMSGEEVEELTNKIVELIHQERTSKELLADEQRKLIADEARRSIEQQRRVRGIDDRNIIKSFAGRFGLNMLNPTRAFQRIDGYQNNGVFTNLGKHLNDGQTKMNTFVMNASKKFNGFLEKHPDLVKTWYKADIDTGYKDKNGKPVYINKGMRIALYLHSLNNDQNMRHIAEGGIKVPDAALYNKGQYEKAYRYGTILQMKPTEISALLAEMTDDEKAFANLAHEFLNNDTKKAINDTSLELTGTMKAIVDNYFPIRTDPNFTMKDITGLVVDGTIEGMGMLKERVKGAKNAILLEDVAQVLQRQTNNTGRYYGLAIPVRDFNKILKFKEGGINESVRSVLDEVWGDAGINYITDVLNNIQAGSPAENGPGAKLFNTLKGTYAGTVLNWNLGVAIKQSASAPFAAVVLDPKSIAKAFAMNAFSKADYDYMDSITPWSYMRRQGMSGTEMGEVYRQKNAIESNRAWQKFKQKTNFIQNVDVWTTDRLFFAAEYYVRDHFPELKVRGPEYNLKVAEIYNDMLQRTQPSYDVMQRNAYLRSGNTLTKIMGMFKTQTFNMGGEIIDAAGRLNAYRQLNKQGQVSDAQLKEAKAQFGKTVGAAAVSQLMLAALAVVAKAIMHNMKDYRDDNGEVTPESVAARGMYEFLTSFAGMFMGGNELQSYLLSLSGKEKWYDLAYPGISVINDLASSSVDMTDAFRKAVDKGWDDESASKFRKKAIQFAMNAAIVKRIPADNIYKIGNAINLWVQDYKNGMLGSFAAGEGLLGLKDSSPTADQYANMAINAYKNGNSKGAELAMSKVKPSKVEDALGAEAKKDENGDSISGSKMADALQKVNDLDMSMDAKLELILKMYPEKTEGLTADLVDEYADMMSAKVDGKQEGVVEYLKEVKLSKESKRILWELAGYKASTFDKAMNK